ncbi:hypothetical protein D3C85_1576940 [compost metagenome]
MVEGHISGIFGCPGKRGIFQPDRYHVFWGGHDITIEAGFLCSEIDNAMFTGICVKGGNQQAAAGAWGNDIFKRHIQRGSVGNQNTPQGRLQRAVSYADSTDIIIFG